MGKKISKNQARQWTSGYQQNGKGAKSIMFEKADLLALLNQPECEGLEFTMLWM